MIATVVQILISYILSVAGEPIKEEARQYLKDKLSGWKEDLALKVFDAAWAIAIKSATRIPKISFAAADALADAQVASLKEIDKGEALA